MRARSVVLLAVVVAACGRRESLPQTSRIDPSAQASASASASASAASTADPESVDAGPPVAWAEAVRLEKWDDAARSLDLLDDAEKSKPDIRYVRARVALARAKYDDVAPLLEGLETQLPLLGEDIARRRAEAALHVGPYALAGDWFAARPGGANQVLAAEAYEKAKLPAKARAVCDRIVAAEKKSRAQEAEARAMRVRLAEKRGEQEKADDRWLAVHAPDLSWGAHAKVEPQKPLTGQELMTRAKALADAGKLDDAIRAVDDSANAPAPGTTHLERIRAKGYFLYKSKARYLEAAKILAEAATNAGQWAAEDAFHAARALSRADKDDEAIPAYEKVAQKYPRSPWGEEAAYFVPYLHILHAEWALAAKGFDDFVKKYPDSPQHKEDAARNRAIAHLMNKDYKLARTLFERLSADEADPLASARMANMAALAALKDGDKLHAQARWTEVARSRPLSYPALVARARLTELGAPLPPTIDPPEAGAPQPPLVTVLPAPVDLLHRLGLDADAEIALREREAQVVTSAPGRTVEALCAAYGKLGRAKRRFEVAQRQVPSSLLQAAPGPRTRWAWECVYPSPYEGHVAAAETDNKLPRGLIYAVMRQESAYDPDAVSPARAIGLLQLITDTAKSTAAEIGGAIASEEPHLTSPPYNIAVGARHLRDLLDRFHNQLAFVVGAYNAGPEPIARWATRAGGMDLDVYVERIPFKETRDYVGRVLGNLARYGYLREGEAGVPTLNLSLAN